MMENIDIRCRDSRKEDRGFFYLGCGQSARSIDILINLQNEG